MLRIRYSLVSPLVLIAIVLLAPIACRSAEPNREDVRRTSAAANVHPAICIDSRPDPDVVGRDRRGEPAFVRGDRIAFWVNGQFRGIYTYGDSISQRRTGMLDVIPDSVEALELLSRQLAQQRSGHCEVDGGIALVTR